MSTRSNITVVINEIKELIKGTGDKYLKLIRDPKIKCQLHFHKGNGITRIITVSEILLQEDGSINIHDGRRTYNDTELVKDDAVLLLNAVKQVLEIKTPTEFCEVINRCQDFPDALHDVITRNGWEDWSNDTDSNLILIDNDRNQTVRLDNDNIAFVD